MDFLYFVRCAAPKEAVSVLAQAGIVDVFEGDPTTVAHCEGFIVCNGRTWADQTGHIRFNSDEQVWQQVNDDVRIGFYRNSRPTPDILARSNQIPGYAMPMYDGHNWIIPTARHWESNGKLSYKAAFPAAMRFDGKKWSADGAIADEYASLWSTVEEWGETPFDVERSFVDEHEKEIDYAVQMLSANYRVTAHEVSLLGLLSSSRDEIRLIFAAALDLPAYAEIKKKQESELAST